MATFTNNAKMQSSAPTVPDLIPPLNVTTPTTPTVSPVAPPPNTPALTRAAAPNSQSTLHPSMHASPKMQCHISQPWDNQTHLSLQQRTHMYPPPITPIALVQFSTLQILHGNTKIQHSHHHRLTTSALLLNRGSLKPCWGPTDNWLTPPTQTITPTPAPQGLQTTDGTSKTTGPPHPNPNNIPLPQSQTLFQYGFVPNPPTQFQPVNQFFNPNNYANEAW